MKSDYITPFIERETKPDLFHTLNKSDLDIAKRI